MFLPICSSVLIRVGYLTAWQWRMLCFESEVVVAYMLSMPFGDSARCRHLAKCWSVRVDERTCAKEAKTRQVSPLRPIGLHAFYHMANVPVCVYFWWPSGGSRYGYRTVSVLGMWFVSRRYEDSPGLWDRYVVGRHGSCLFSAPFAGGTGGSDGYMELIG